MQQVSQRESEEPTLPGMDETPQERTRRLLQAEERDHLQAFTEKPKAWKRKGRHAGSDRD